MLSIAYINLHLYDWQSFTYLHAQNLTPDVTALSKNYPYKVFSISVNGRLTFLETHVKKGAVILSSSFSLKAQIQNH